MHIKCGRKRLKNVKFIIGFSFFGFLLSAVFGFNSQGNYFARVILHALIFAVVFAGLAVLIQFVFSKVLEFDSESGGDGGIAPAAAGSGASASSHSVDIVVQDEELPDDADSSQFYVGNSRQMLSPDDSKQMTPAAEQGAGFEPKAVSEAEGAPSASPVQAAPVTLSEAAKQVSAENAAGSGAAGGFVPISLAETPKNVSSVESMTQADIKKVEKSASAPAAAEGGSEEQLDSLPDLEDLSGFAPSISPAPSGDAEVESGDSGFSESVPGNSLTAEEVTSGKDAELMAKAISTLLAKE